MSLEKFLGTILILQKTNKQTNKVKIVKLMIVIIYSFLVLIYFYTIGTGMDISFPFAYKYRFLGEGLGGLALWTLVAVYFRSVLKIAIKHKWLDRLYDLLSLKEEKYKKIPMLLLKYLTVYHPIIGFIAFTSLTLHCIFSSNFINIPILRTVLILMITQGILGILIKIKLPSFIRKKVYSWHTNLNFVVLIAIFAAIGHLFVD